MKPPGGLRQNPFRDSQAKPEWAQLTRLAGDRASILFEDLRRRLGVVEGLQEQLHYGGPDWGWTPHYRLEGTVLCTVGVLPGLLEGGIELEGTLREKLLRSPRVAARIKDAIRSASVRNDTAIARIEISDRAAVRAFAAVVLMKARLLTGR